MTSKITRPPKTETSHPNASSVLKTGWAGPVVWEAERAEAALPEARLAFTSTPQGTSAEPGSYTCPSAAEVAFYELKFQGITKVLILLLFV